MKILVLQIFYASTFALIRESIGIKSNAFIRESYTFIRDSFALISESNAFIRKSFAFIRDSLTLIRESFAIIREKYAKLFACPPPLPRSLYRGSPWTQWGP